MSNCDLSVISIPPARDHVSYSTHRHRTFYGKTRQELVFTDKSVADPVRVKEEPFFSLLVDVAEEGRDVYDGLDAVFDDAPVEIEGKQARRRVSLVEVPDLLQVQLQRVQYDREKQKIFKSNQHMAFGPEISMDRYLQAQAGDEDGQRRKAETSKRREEMDVCRTRLAQLQSFKVSRSEAFGICGRSEED